MKKNILYQLLFFSFTFIFATGFQCEAQKDVHQSKKSNSLILFPRKKTRRTIIYNQENLPPGQAKKIYGTKSAKPFAPGQRKKQYYYQMPNYDQHGKGKHEEHHENKKEKDDRD